MNPIIRRTTAVALLVLGSTATAVAAWAHPLGNLTSNTYAGLLVTEDGITVDYVLDLAEVPTVQTRGDIDTDADGQVSPAEAVGYAEERCLGLADGLRLARDGVHLPLTVEDSTVSFPEGQAGLVTLRLECQMLSDVRLAAGATVQVADDNLADRLGWHEITASGARLASADVRPESISARLADYPDDVAPLDIRTAELTIGVAGEDPLAAFVPTGGIGALERASGGLMDLIGRQQLTVGFVFLAAGIAVVLGSMHALAPGHGKTVMAAYLISREGTLRQMVGLGSTVALTHTLGVLLLGVLVTTSQALAPERLFPWLGVASGTLFAVLGVWLLLRARHGHDHDHDHGHGHGHGHGHDHGHDHDHDHDHSAHTRPATSAPVGWRSLVLPGLAGGMLPSPSALVVLVAGITLGRLGFGLVLVIAYGVGMALTLMGAGWLLVKMRHRLVGRLAASDRWGQLTSRLPAVTASLVILGGIVISLRSVLTL